MVRQSVEMKRSKKQWKPKKATDGIIALLLGWSRIPPPWPTCVLFPPTHPPKPPQTREEEDDRREEVGRLGRLADHDLVPRSILNTLSSILAEATPCSRDPRRWFP